MNSTAAVSDRKPLLIIMVKAPEPGTVKTRLCPPLSIDQAASLAACFVRDVTAIALSVCPHVLIAFAPAEGRRLLESLLPPGLRWTVQRGEDLGERMQTAFEEGGAGGFAPLVMIGTDSPALPPVILAGALQLLANDQGNADMVLGPADDGGYYLIGVRNPFPGLLENVAWSTSETLAHTARNAAALNLRVSRLPRWYDVDTPEDLKRLAADFSADPLLQQRAPHTYEWLKTHETLDNHPHAE